MEKMTAAENLVLVGRTETYEPKPGTSDVTSNYTDDEIALLFAERHEDDLRYVAAWNRWLRFDGRRWAADRTRQAFALVRDLCRELACSSEKIRALRSAKKIGAVHKLAQADRRLAAEPDVWDMDPDILNDGD
jgi:putative DNA primase/helicase